MAWWWLALAAGAVVGLALWLRTTSVPYLALASLATALSLAAVLPGRAGRSGALAAALLAIGTLVAGLYQRQLVLVDTQWPRYAREVTASGVAALRDSVDHEVRALRGVAEAALRAPNDADLAFGTAESALGTAPQYRSVVLYRDTSPLAWAGDVRVPIQDVDDTVTVRLTPFYVGLVVTARSGIRRAVASSLLHAEPPGDRLGRALDNAILTGAELRSFEYGRPESADAGWSALRFNGRDLIFVRPVLLSQGEARVRLVERARLSGGIVLALAALALLGVAWQRPASLPQRLGALVVAAVVIALVPFSAYSNISRVFDPAVYYAPIGGPLTASVGTLAAAGALALLGCFALARSRMRFRSRWAAWIAVIVVASLGPFLLRDLARGITLPQRGAAPTLWMAWQLALFLAASATLLIGVGAGRVALAGSRGLSPVLAPAIAAVAAIVSPILWQAPGRWPAWYMALWIAAMVALAFARRSRTLVLAVGFVAACGATTLVWGAISRKRVELAQTDVAQLSLPDSSSLELLDRFARTLESEPSPLEREDLLLRYVRSPLAAAGHPVGLAVWLPGGDMPHAELHIADFEQNLEAVRALVASARATGLRASRTERSSQGVQSMLAVPHADSAVTTVIVAPRTLLIPEDPFTSLIGLAPLPSTEPPYDATVDTLPSPILITDRPRWVRKLNELHGDWHIPGAPDASRVHVEVDLRGLDVLLPRGALIVLLDLLMLSALWTLAAAADGSFLRWSRFRIQRWARSYRGRLTVTLFAFFVIPAAGFALSSYRRLQATDRDSRVLLIGETLRTVTSAAGNDNLDTLSDRFDTPLLEYRGGALRGVSDPLYDMLAPVGRFLPRSVAINLGVESELTDAARPLVGDVHLLFGYRTVVRGTGERAVLAAPARTNERALDRERRDIGMLVLFVTSLGALAAMWLSGRAARELERPVGALRRAALRIARGERYPGPDETPAVEFVPVFSAFERMDADLAASRAAVQEAQRRTEAVLRDVASGVIATDGRAAITLANASAEAILGHTIAPGMTLLDVGADILHQRTLAFLASTVDTEAFDLELEGRQLRGSLTRLALATGGAVLTLDDVTEIARAQRVLAWGEMARQVAHEIKNPLTPIRLGVQHLRRARNDPRVDFDRVFEQNASRILAEIDRLDEIARAFSRYGMVPAERDAAERVDVAVVVRDVVELERIGVSDITWHLAGVDDVVPAFARKSELRDVLLNLLENARQANARNVTVSVERRDGRVDIVVADDGDGIPEEHLGRVFEPRFSTRTSGSGLGLAISRGLVTSWGGEMQVTSARGQGTQMRITLAAALDD